MDGHGEFAGPVTLREANQWFERALAFDPRFARAALLHADRYGYRLLFGPGDPIADLADSTLEEAAQRLAQSLDIAIRHAPDTYERAVAEINREFFSSNWRRLPGLLEQFRREITLARPSADDNWLAHVLIATGISTWRASTPNGLSRSIGCTSSYGSPWRWSRWLGATSNAPGRFLREASRRSLKGTCSHWWISCWRR